jgi:hypothetical protein
LRPEALERRKDLGLSHACLQIPAQLAHRDVLPVGFLQLPDLIGVDARQARDRRLARFAVPALSGFLYRALEGRRKLGETGREDILVHRRSRPSDGGVCVHPRDEYQRRVGA